MKRFFYVVVTSIVVFLITINLHFSTNQNISDVSIEDLVNVALAQTEGDPQPNSECKQDPCSVTIGPPGYEITYYGHYWHCGYGVGECITSECAQSCDAL